MNFKKVYQCKCGKIYNKYKTSLPTYCEKCGSELYDKYEYTNPNMFGGYDNINCVLSDNIQSIIAKRQWFKWIIKE